MMSPGSHSLQKQAMQLRLLNEVSTKLQGLIQADDFFQEIINLIQSQFHYYSIHIWSVSPNQAATLQAQAGAYGQHIQIGHTIDRDEGIVGHVVQTQRSHNSPDVSVDPHYTNLSAPVLTRSELTVPVLSGGQTVAVLNVESDQPSAFDRDDLLTLEAVASQISVAIENRKLFREAQIFNRTLQTTVEEKTAELRSAHERILEQQRLLQKENKALKTLVRQEGNTYEIIGRSPALLSMLQMVDKIAPTTATVLIQGESGTGKELIARRLHVRSERSSAPYVTVNCGALQESLLESELFGHEKGSFTGAVNQKLGLAETADGGTLFLDEIGEMSPQIQTKLLRFLQEGEFYRIGGKRPVKVDVRVLSATNRDLEQEVKAGRFREDLFYRLNTITLRMPPLRKRTEDIPALIDHFLQNSRFGGGMPIRKVDPRVYTLLSQYDWPGNIRELQNTIERMKILAENNELTIQDVPLGIRQPKMKEALDAGTDLPPDLPLEEVEKHHILRSLAHHQGNKTKTAQVLGITIKTLYNKLQRYGMHLPSAGAAPGLTVGPLGSPADQEQKDFHPTPFSR